MAGTWKIKVPLALGPGEMTRSYISTEQYAADYLAGKADKWAYGGKIFGVLPTGTLDSGPSAD